MKSTVAPPQTNQGAPGFTDLPYVGRADTIGIVILSIVLLLLAYFQSRHRIYWGDEIMGRYVLDAGSWHLFQERWNAGIDSSGFWFYVFAKPWEWVFGRSELALRMFSAAGVATGAALAWITARRFYGITVVAISVPLFFLDSAVLRWQLSNGRCYGVLLASTALVIYLVLRRQDEPQANTPASLLVGTFLAYDILAGSHILGMLYAGALLAIQIALDLRTGRLRIPLYLSAAAGIAAIVLFSVPNIRSTTALGKPVFWTLRPWFSDFFLIKPLTGEPLKPLLPALLVVTMLFLRRIKRRDPVYIVLLGFALLNVLFFAISRVSTSIYTDRYLTPFVFALILLCAEFLTQLRELPPPYTRRAAFVPVLVALYGVFQWTRLPANVYPKLDFTAPLLAELPPSLPVVDTDVGSFVELEFYHHGRFNRPFLYPLDPGVTADLRNPGGISGLHEMDNFARLGIDRPDLQPTEDILSRYPELLVITGMQPTAWLRLRLLEERHYTVTKLGFLPGDLPLTLWNARRTDSPAISPALR